MNIILTICSKLTSAFLSLPRNGNALVMLAWYGLITLCVLFLDFQNRESLFTSPPFPFFDEVHMVFCCLLCSELTDTTVRLESIKRNASLWHPVSSLSNESNYQKEYRQQINKRREWWKVRNNLWS